MAIFNNKLLLYQRVTLDLNLVLASEVLVEPQSLLVQLQLLLLFHHYFASIASPVSSHHFAL